MSDLIFSYDPGPDEPELPAGAEQLPDGVYLDLEPEEYFQQPGRIGSSDIMTLDKKGHGWWWQSPHNPLKTKPESTDAQNYGSALHVLMLEGRSAFNSRFLIAPDKAAFGDRLLESTDQIKTALAQRGFVPPTGASKWKKEQWVQEAQVCIPDVPVWDAIWGAFIETAKDEKGRPRPFVNRTELAMLNIMVEAAFDTDTPEGAEMARLMGEGEAAEHPPLAEVSVLYTDAGGRRRRARIDRMFPAFDLDLKSLRGHWNGRPLPVAIDDVIRGQRYDMQRADYYAARRRIYGFIAAGMNNVHGGGPEQRAWIAQFPDRFPRWEWVWLFYQKPEMAAGDGPVLFPLWDDHRSTYHVNGLRKCVRALQTYDAFVERFGLTRPWTHIEALHYTNQEHLPHILTYPDNSPAAAGEVPEESELAR